MMKKTLLAILATAAALCAMPAYAETVEIASAADWAAFAGRVNNGETTLNAKLTADITLTGDPVRVGLVTSGDGAVSHTYAGEFDGHGHTITLDWAYSIKSSMDLLAPFAHVSGCTIHDLRIAGSLTTDLGYASGFIGDVYGGAVLERCRCSVGIAVDSNSIAMFVGGFFAATDTLTQNREVIFRDCLFDGALQLPRGIYCAGFGYSLNSDSHIRIYNSLFAPGNVQVTLPATLCTTFTSSDNSQLSRAYRTQTFGIEQGTDASSMSAGELAAALGENWIVLDGKPTPVFNSGLVLSDKQICTVASDKILAGAAGESAIAVEDGASAIINIKSGATLTVSGGNASGTTGAAPAIRVPETSTLYIVGDGTLVATGGAAANGGTGGDGSTGQIDIPNVKGRGGAGGAGGAGGGGGAPAIGGIGGAGGAGGSGGDYTAWMPCDNTSYNNNGNRGLEGSSGANGGGMGQVVILGNLTVRSTAGAAATSDGAGGANGEKATDKGSGWDYDYTGGGGGGGGGGARGQDAQYGIGGGGAGGAGGGGGGGGGTYCSSTTTPYITLWGAGGAGGSSYCGTAGADGICGRQSNDYVGGYGGNGGAANTTRGDSGTLQALDSVALTVSPARTAAQPTALSAGDAPAAPVAVTFMSDGTSVGTEQATLMLAPPAAPAASKAGYAFQGYYTAGGTQIYDADCNPVYPVWQTVEDTTLYAHWVPAYSVTFVSTDATVGSGVYVEGETGAAAPIPTRSGDYIFLGYFTEDGSQVFDASGALMEGTLAGLPSDVTLYARWGVPEGSVVKLVYRGQLNLLTGDPAVHSSTYTKKMHFRVYDSSESTTPLWTTGEGGIDVTVNKDGSFVQVFGDDTLAELLATGTVTHVGLAIGDSAMELKPRRELRPVAAVNHALTAEGAALDIRIGNLVTDNALVAADATVSQLEVTGRVTAPGAGEVAVSPLTVGDRERTRLMRGAGVKAFSAAKPTVLVADTGAKLRGEVLVAAPSDGIALITSKAGGERALRCPAVVQYCRAGESVRAPTSEAGGLKVTFFPFIGK